jgi:hypothetical protein
MSEDVLDFVTKFVFWVMFAITAFLNLSRRIPAGAFWQEIRPDSNLLGLSLLIAVTATWFHPDPAEFLLALAAIYYAKLLAQRLLNDRTTAQAFVQRTPKPSGRM